MRLFISGLRKLTPRLATLLTFGLLAGLLALIILAVTATGGVGGNGGGGGARFDPLSLVTFPGAYNQILSFILGLGGIFGVIYGAAIAGSEWSWGTLKAVVARGESRSRYVLSTFAAVAVILAVGFLTTFLIGVVTAVLGATLAGVPLNGIGDADALGRLPQNFGRGWVAIVAEGALGFAVATLARSQLAGIGVGIAIYFGGTFAGIFLPDVVQYLPFQLANTAVGAGGGFGGGVGGAPTMSADLALLLLAVWLLASLALAALFTERAEITG
jgi:ABC-type transport system involved in multi-copper enzyme maturation permease subunit